MLVALLIPTEIRAEDALPRPTLLARAALEREFALRTLDLTFENRDSTLPRIYRKNPLGDTLGRILLREVESRVELRPLGNPTAPALQVITHNVREVRTFTQKASRFSQASPIGTIQPAGKPWQSADPAILPILVSARGLSISDQWGLSLRSAVEDPNPVRLEGILCRVYRTADLHQAKTNWTIYCDEADGSLVRLEKAESNHLRRVWTITKRQDLPVKNWPSAWCYEVIVAQGGVSSRQDCQMVSATTKPLIDDSVFSLQFPPKTSLTHAIHQKTYRVDDNGQWRVVEGVTNPAALATRSSTAFLNRYGWPLIGVALLLGTTLLIRHRALKNPRGLGQPVPPGT
jgi:hypothetical protein